MSKIKKKLKNQSIGGIVTESGSTAKYKTGTWRNQMPLLDRKKCTNCLICANFCPENCIKIRNHESHTNLGTNYTNKLNEFEISHIDYFFCKGCGICANECPQKAIEMREV
jgi:pyruvate ferredoxin oxidoreductase delta subunit